MNTTTIGAIGQELSARAAPLLAAAAPHLALAEPYLTLAEPYLTAENAALGVRGMLLTAGLMHAIPGPLLKLQSRLMGLPGWFIICAGLLMIGSATLYAFRPTEGLYAVGVCMGGAFATAALMPNFMHRPGGMIFSSFTLFAAFWAGRPGCLEDKEAGLCVAAWLLGALGRIVVPRVEALNRLLSSERKAAAPPRATDAATPPAAEEAAPRAAGGPAAPQAAARKTSGTKANPGALTSEPTPTASPAQLAKAKAGSQGGGARRRVDSPAPRGSAK